METDQAKLAGTAASFATGTATTHHTKKRQVLIQIVWRLHRQERVGEGTSRHTTALGVSVSNNAEMV
jgi:hypothetical protein